MGNTRVRNYFSTITKSNWIYADSAATAQMPDMVIERLAGTHGELRANAHRGLYKAAEQYTEQYEQVRQKVADFIGAEKATEIIFTSGTTESINVVARGWGLKNLSNKKRIVITHAEHHSNYIPWTEITKETGAELAVLSLDKNYTVNTTDIENLITPDTALVAITLDSNVIGPIWGENNTALTALIKRARQVGAKILCDAAQAIGHQKINIKELDVDFLAFSGHKLGAPAGTGILYIRQSEHAHISPVRFGGGMVSVSNALTCSTSISGESDSAVSTPVTHLAGTESKSSDTGTPVSSYSWLPVPHGLEAGTQNSTGIIGLGAAIDFYNTHINYTELKKHESALVSALIDQIESIQGLTIVGNKELLRSGGHAVSFYVDGIHAHDLAHYLGTKNICVRAGDHCAQPLTSLWGGAPTVRVSFFVYNTLSEVEIIAREIRAGITYLRALMGETHE